MLFAVLCMLHNNKTRKVYIALQYAIPNPPVWLVAWPCNRTKTAKTYSIKVHLQTWMWHLTERHIVIFVVLLWLWSLGKCFMFHTLKLHLPYVLVETPNTDWSIQHAIVCKVLWHAYSASMQHTRILDILPINIDRQAATSPVHPISVASLWYVF